MRRALYSAIAGALLGGCSYHCNVRSTPTGAQLQFRDGTTATTPANLTLRGGPFTKRRVTISAIGYRSMSLSLRQAREIEVVLVPEHGSVGTWTQEEVP